MAKPEAERRQLTVMFCDLVGSTRLAGKLDPEDLRELTRAYQEAALGVIRKYDGHVAQLLGDGILAYFGYPVAHENAAHRACHAALDVLQAIDELNVRLAAERAVTIAVRIGAHTGITVVGLMGDSVHREQLAIGEAPNVAARLQSLAQPGTAVISGATARLVRGAFSWEDLGLHQLAGVPQPVEVYRLRRAVNTRRQTAVPGQEEPFPFVGRTGDLSMLRECWKESRAGRGRMVVISGEPGIGKSRLVRAFRASVLEEAQRWFECHCSPFYTNTAMRPLIEMISELCELGEQDSPEKKRDKVATFVSRLFPGNTDALPLLASLLSIPVAEEAQLASALTPQAKKQKLQKFLLDLFSRLSESKPLVLVIEDLHWMDPTSLEFIGLLAKHVSKTHLLVILTTRSSFEVPWLVDTRVSLSGLARDEVVCMIERVAGGKQLPVELVELLVHKADGNPLYVEELTRMLIESGQLIEQEGGYHLSVLLPSLQVPASLHDSLMARLDRLDRAKIVLQVGATIARQFDYALLKELLVIDDATLQQELARLSEAGLLYRRGDPPHAAYNFRSALIQDAAYGSLLKRTRQQYHRRIAELLPKHVPDTPPEILAHHHREAGQVVEALRCYSAAGQASLGAWALGESTRHLECALSLVDKLPDRATRALEELSLRVAIGVPLMLTRGYAAPEVETTYRRAYELCLEVGDAAADRLFPVLWGLWIFYHVKAVLPKAEDMGERLLQLAERSGDSGIALGAHQALGSTRFWRGRVSQARVHFETALALYDEKKHARLAFLFGQDARAYGLAFLVWIAWLEGDLEGARRYRQEALAHCARLGQPGSQGFVELIVAVFHCLMGEHELAMEHSRRLIALSREQRMPHWEACGRITLGWCNRTGEGASIIRAGIDSLNAVGTRTASSFWHSALVEAELRGGNLEKAQVALDALMAFIQESDERCYEAELVRLQGELLLRRGESRRAAERFRDALELALSRSQPTLAQRARLSLERTPGEA
ncbi:ATP-binding protein [Archangium violaceum]|uniref:ATP-binding protein n=1 Tax=Archangium violaceum TaxID=83451 RepID=UPI001EF5D981|nr:AAA family ATPase [Archangium violaceum]